MDLTGYGNPAELVRAARQERGLTQQDLADRMGCSQAAIAQMEHAANMGTETLAKVLKELGYSPLFVAVP